MNTSLIVTLVVAGVIVLAVISMYNTLVTLRNGAKTAWSKIDVRLQQRYDLIPNLVNIAKKYMQHERETLEAVISARNAAYTACRNTGGDPTNKEAMGELMQAEGGLGGVLGRLLAVSESYPDLKANQEMLQLMGSLSDMETTIARARETYNNEAMQYNIKRETFPSSIVAGMFHFEEAKLFQVGNAEVRKAPKVSFD